jgi:spore germination protein YaaH
VLKDAEFEPEYNTTESTEFYSVPGEDDGTWNAVYYDSPRSLTPKLALADDRGLAGAGFWAIGYERGLPRYTKLIAKFAAGELRETKPAE